VNVGGTGTASKPASRADVSDAKTGFSSRTDRANDQTGA
jgi:hypothetical protein